MNDPHPNYGLAGGTLDPAKHVERVVKAMLTPEEQRCHTGLCLLRETVGIQRIRDANGLN